MNRIHTVGLLFAVVDLCAVAYSHVCYGTTDVIVSNPDHSNVSCEQSVTVSNIGQLNPACDDIENRYLTTSETCSSAHCLSYAFMVKEWGGVFYGSGCSTGTNMEVTLCKTEITTAPPTTPVPPTTPPPPRPTTVTMVITELSNSTMDVLTLSTSSSPPENNSSMISTVFVSTNTMTFPSTSVTGTTGTASSTASTTTNGTSTITPGSASTTDDPSSTTIDADTTTDEATTTTTEATTTTDESTSTTTEATTTTEEVTSTTTEATTTTTEEVTSTATEATTTIVETTSTTTEGNATTGTSGSTTTGATPVSMNSTTEEVTNTTQELSTTTGSDTLNNTGVTGSTVLTDGSSGTIRMTTSPTPLSTPGFGAHTQTCLQFNMATKLLNCSLAGKIGVDHRAAASYVTGPSRVAANFLLNVRGYSLQCCEGNRCNNITGASTPSKQITCKHGSTDDTSDDTTTTETCESCWGLTLTVRYTTLIRRGCLSHLSPFTADSAATNAKQCDPAARDCFEVGGKKECYRCCTDADRCNSDYTRTTIAEQSSAVSMKISLALLLITVCFVQACFKVS